MKYHPCSKEFQEMTKKLGLTGNQYIQKLREEEKLIDPIKIYREKRQQLVKRYNCNNYKEYLDLFAKNRGFNNYKEYRDYLASNMGYNCRAERDKDWRYNTLRSGSMLENDECSTYFGIYIAERYVRELFEDIIPMPINNPGFDWICKNGFKIDNKARCLEEGMGTIRWIFPIKYNNLADYFILSGWKDRSSLEPMCVWIFNRNEIIRGRKFWRRESFCITNKPEYLLELKKYELPKKLEELKEKIIL